MLLLLLLLLLRRRRLRFLSPRSPPSASVPVAAGAAAAVTRTPASSCGAAAPPPAARAARPACRHWSSCAAWCEGGSASSIALPGSVAARLAYLAARAAGVCEWCCFAGQPQAALSVIQSNRVPMLPSPVCPAVPSHLHPLLPRAHLSAHTRPFTAHTHTLPLPTTLHSHPNPPGQRLLASDARYSPAPTCAPLFPSHPACPAPTNRPTHPPTRAAPPCR